MVAAETRNGWNYCRTRFKIGMEPRRGDTISAWYATAPLIYEAFRHGVVRDGRNFAIVSLKKKRLYQAII